MVLTKTLLLKHYYRRQGAGEKSYGHEAFLTKDMWVVNCIGGGLVVKHPGVLSEVLRLDLVSGDFSPLAK